MCTKYTTTVRNNVCCKFILEYNQYEIYKTYEQRTESTNNTLCLTYRAFRCLTSL